MPIRAHDGRRLVDLRRDERQPLFRQSKDVDLDVERIVRAELCDNSTRENIEILESARGLEQERRDQRRRLLEVEVGEPFSAEFELLLHQPAVGD